MNQRGFANIIIIVVIVVLAVATGYFVTNKSQQRSTQSVPTVPTSQVPNHETANWEIYRNEQYGFTFKNSPNLQFVESKARYYPAIFVLEVPAHVVGGSSAFVWVVPENLIEQQFRIRPLKFQHQPKNLSELADELIKFNNTKDQFGFVRTITAKEISTESGLNGTKITIMEGEHSKDSGPASSYFFYKSPYFYEFLQAQGDAIDAQLAKVVSTFEFIK